LRVSSDEHWLGVLFVARRPAASRRDLFFVVASIGQLIVACFWDDEHSCLSPFISSSGARRYCTCSAFCLWPPGARCMHGRRRSRARRCSTRRLLWGRFYYPTLSCTPTPHNSMNVHERDEVLLSWAWVATPAASKSVSVSRSTKHVAGRRRRQRSAAGGPRGQAAGGVRQVAAAASLRCETSVVSRRRA
jgi:hypothetical protein